MLTRACADPFLVLNKYSQEMSIVIIVRYIHFVKVVLLII